MSLKTIRTKRAKQVLGLQSKRKPRRLKIWNETLEESIKSKKNLPQIAKWEKKMKIILTIKENEP
jgi:hypothetical protein